VDAASYRRHRSCHDIVLLRPLRQAAEAGRDFPRLRGMCPKPNVRVEAARTGGLAIRNAYAYIKSGLCDSMIVYGTENMGRHVPSDVAQQFIALASDTDWRCRWRASMSPITP